jgi:hypothetical protein
MPSDVEEPAVWCFWCVCVCVCAADVVVSVSRKTDASLWPALFSAVGSPSAVLEMLLDTGSLTSAACFLIVVDRWGLKSYE